MKQVLLVKKTSVDEKLKATITLEFSVSDPESQANVFDFIKLQGLPVTIEATPFEEQPELFPPDSVKDSQGHNSRPDYKKEPPARA